MALSDVDIAILGCLDRMGYQKTYFRENAYTASNDNWYRVDHSGDEAFENRVSSAASSADAEIANCELGQGSGVGDFLQHIVNYFVQDTDYTSLDNWLTSRRLRLNLQAANLIAERWSQSYLSAANVAGRADAGASAPGNVLGEVVSDGAGGETFTERPRIDTSVASASPILLRVLTNGGATAWDVDVTLQRTDGTEVTINETIAGAASVGDTQVIANQTPTSGAASGQKVVEVGTTTHFATGQKVLLVDWNGTAPNEQWVAQEVAVIDSISAGTSLTMKKNLLHSYTTGAHVWPCFVKITDMATNGSNGDNTDEVHAFPRAERRLRLD